MGIHFVSGASFSKVRFNHKTNSSFPFLGSSLILCLLPSDVLRRRERERGRRGGNQENTC